MLLQGTILQTINWWRGSEVMAFNTAFNNISVIFLGYIKLLVIGV
jgi:hypothetical protein